MLQTQVEYWKLVETKRHNLEQERQGRKNLEIGESQATSSRIQANASAVQAAAAKEQAVNAAVTASANLQQAQAAAQNAATNARNAEVNAANAATNARNAEINQQNANTREYEAVTGRISAQAQATQARSSWENAMTNRMNYNLEAEKTDFLYSDTGAGFQVEKTKADASMITAQARATEAGVKESELGLKRVEIFSNPNVTGDTSKRITAEIGKYESESALNVAKSQESKASTALKQQQTKESKSQTVKNVVDTISKAWTTLKDSAAEVKSKANDLYNKSVIKYYTK